MIDCKTISELLGASRKVHLAQIKLAPSYFPIASRSFSEPAAPFQIRRTQKDTGTHRAQPLAELSLTERTEVLRPSEARCSVRAKRGVMPRRRRRVKLGCVETRMRISAERINALGRRESVLCTYGICIKTCSNPVNFRKPPWNHMKVH